MLHASRGLSKLRNKSRLNDLCGEDNASRCRCAPIQDWLVVSLINQVDSTCASVMFSASYLIAGWLLIFAGAARRHMGLPDVARALQLIEDGERLRVVARTLGVPPSVVSRLYRRYQETGEYTRRQGEGRSRMTTPRQGRFLVLLSRRNRMSTARALEIDFRHATAVHLSDQTVTNRLHDDGMRAIRPARGPIVTVQHRVQRLDFAREHQNGQLSHWVAVLFTDENRFTVSTNDRRARVWIRQGERYADCNIVEVDRYGGGSVMVWAGISLDGHTDWYVFARGFITAVRYRNEVLGPIVRPFAGAIGDAFISMQDNARAHTALVSSTFLNDEGISVVNWPARSPYPNPLDHAWDMYSRSIRQRNIHQKMYRTILMP